MARSESPDGRRVGQVVSALGEHAERVRRDADRHERANQSEVQSQDHDQIVSVGSTMNQIDIGTVWQPSSAGGPGCDQGRAVLASLTASETGIRRLGPE